MSRVALQLDAQIAGFPGVRDSVESAIDLAKGLDLESWEQRLREEPGRIPRWEEQPRTPPVGASVLTRPSLRGISIL